MLRNAPELFLLFPFFFLLIIVGVDLYRRYSLSKGCLSHPDACENIERWYGNLEDGWSAPLDQSKQVPERLDSPLYGEITWLGMENLAKELDLSYLDVFYDLGSGVGKLVIYLYLTTPVQKSIGIEMVGARHAIAMSVREQLRSDGLLTDKRQLEFLYANLRETDFSDATVIYMSSLCFPTELMQELSQRFLTMKPGLRIISSQLLSHHPRLRLVKQGFLAMTWTSTSWTYYYELL